MARNERYIATVELNSQQAQDRLKELEKKVQDLKKAKEEALKSGGFFDEASLKRATKELNQWRIQMTGVQGILENINDATIKDLQGGLRKLRNELNSALPGTAEFNQIQSNIAVIEDRIKQIRTAFRDNNAEAERLTKNAENLSKVFYNINSASLNELLMAQKYLEENIAKMDPAVSKGSTDLLKQVKTRIQEIKTEQQQVVTLMDKYDQEIKQVNDGIIITSRETKHVDETMKNLSKASMRQLEYSIKIVNEQLKDLPRGTAEFDRMQERAKKLRTELERVRYEGAAQQPWINRMANWFNKIQGTVIVGVSSITGLTLTVRRAIQAFADMDQEMENVRKYTGQTTEEVHAMNEEFKQFDTRTSREKLNQLAGDAGRLGIKGRQGLMEFVDAADKLNVALGDDLGENAVKNIGKLAMTFGTDKEKGLRGAMLATGSAINELAQNSSAAANYLVDFTARVAGFGKQVGLTQTQIMGFGAVMDENMLRDEMAATAFGQLLVKMTTDLDTFARLTGLKVEEYKKLVTEDINGAIIAVAKSLKGRDVQDLGKVFDAMNLDGQRAISVLATLGQKVDDVTERQRIATEAFDEGTSIIEEYNIQNKTVQADLDRAKKSFNELRIELGEKLIPIARYGITTGGAIIKLLAWLIEFGLKYRTTLTTLTIAITVLVAWKEKDVIVSKLQVFWTEKVVATTKKLWVLLLNHPFAALSVGVAVVIGLLADMARKSDGVSMALERLNRNREDAKKKAIDEKQSLELLIAASKNEKLSVDERLKAIDKLNGVIPGYITQLDRETAKYKENKRSLDDYITSLERKYELEGARDMLAKLGKEIADATVKLNKAQQAADNAKNAGPGQSYTTSWGSVGNTTSDLTSKTVRDLESANAALQVKLKEREEILKTYGVDLQKEAVSAQNQEENIVSESPAPFSDPTAEEKLRKAAEAAAKKLEAQKKKELKNRNDTLKAETEAELAVLTNQYARGLIDYRSYVAKRDEIMINGFNKRMAIYEEESDEYKQLLNDREQYNLKAVERSERMNMREVETVHQSVMAELQAKQWNDEGEMLEALYQEDIDYLQNKAALFRQGSEERMEIEEEIQEREYLHQLERQKRYEEMLEELKENYLNQGNKRLREIALNGLDELHRQGLLKEEEYQKAKIAIEAQYASAVSPDQQTKKTGGEMLTNARNKVYENAQRDNTDVDSPIVGTIRNYQATMEQLKVLYANDEQNHAAYLAAKAQATSEFCQQLASEFQTAYNMVNQITSAASNYYAAQSDYEVAVMNKKYDKMAEKAGNNQKKLKKIEEKRQKEEAAIKSKYNAKQVKIQIAQAIAQTAMNALNAYGSVVGIPIVGPALAVVAAAAAVAAGMIQVAAIKKQAAAQEAGYYKGGFTGGKRYKKEAGVVHEGEWVANHQAVNNPHIRPMLEYIDKAQKNNTVGGLTSDDISRQLGNGGSAVVMPVVNVNTDNEDLKEELNRSREVNEHLIEIIEEKGINVDFPMDSFHRNYEHYKNLIS